LRTVESGTFAFTAHDDDNNSDSNENNYVILVRVAVIVHFSIFHLKTGLTAKAQLYEDSEKETRIKNRKCNALKYANSIVQ